MEDKLERRSVCEDILKYIFFCYLEGAQSQGQRSQRVLDPGEPDPPTS